MNASLHSTFQQHVVDQLKELAADRLTDPDSVKFRKLVLYHDSFQIPNASDAGEYRLCGELNAKNQMGGYVGYRAFKAETFIKSDTFKRAEEASGAFIEDDANPGPYKECSGPGESIE